MKRAGSHLWGDVHFPRPTPDFVVKKTKKMLFVLLYDWFALSLLNRNKIG
jgi:hypothetical protein